VARRLRIEFAGALYHVTARGNERRSIFRDDADREKYLERLAHYRERFGFQLLAFCLMDNHVHLAIETGREPLSRIMLALQGSYTQAFNRRHDRVGHLFQGRYGAFVVDRERYFIALLRYIHRNPVEARLVERPDQYRWSSDRFYRRGAGPGWINVERGLAYLGGRASEATRRYRSVMGEVFNGPPYDAVVPSVPLIKGDDDFARVVLRQAEEPELARRGLQIETVAHAVAVSRGIELTQLREGRTQDISLARAITAHLGKIAGRIPFVRTAEYLNRDGSTVARDVRRLEDILENSAALRAEVERLRESLLGL
jgi:REP-associated tyrosine transposase